MASHEPQRLLRPLNVPDGPAVNLFVAERVYRMRPLTSCCRRCRADNTSGDGGHELLPTRLRRLLDVCGHGDGLL